MGTLPQNDKREASKRVTMKDIAKDLNISLSSVGRALNNNGRISEETRKRILERAQELNYRTNIVAKKLAIRKKYKILVIMPEKPAYFWDDVASGMRAAKYELEEFGVDIKTISFCLDKEEEGARILKEVKETEADGIALVPMDLKERDQIIETAYERNIPVVLFNDDIISRKRLFFYGPNKELSGRLAGELMGKFLRGEGEICIVVRSRDIFTRTQRIHGFYSEIYKSFPGIKIFNTYSYDLGCESELVRDLLNINPRLCGIYAVDGGGSGSFGLVLKEFGRKDIVLIGHEMSKDSENMLMEGFIDALVCEDRECQGYYPIKMLYEYLVQGTLPASSEIYSNIDIVLRGNANYMNKDKVFNLR